MDKLPSYVKIAIIVALAAGSYAVITYANSFARSSEPGNYRSFAVSAEAKVVAVPDVATLNLQVITEGGKDLAALEQSNTDKVNKVIDFVKNQGVNDKDIKTSGYQLNPRYQNYTCSPQPTIMMMAPSGGSVAPSRPTSVCPPAEIVGYQIIQTLEVKVRDFKKLGAIIQGVVAAGANSVSGPNFTVDDPSALLAEAKGEAIKKARDQAAIIARAGGFRLGSILSIDESGPINFMSGLGGGMEMGVAKSSQAAPTPVIEPGSQEYSSTVTVRFEIR